MKIIDKGVLETLFIDFSQPSEFAKKALLYPGDFGHYICNGDYRIERESLNLFLLFYILNGNIFVKTKLFEVNAKAGEIVLLDCREPHIYGCANAGEFLWFHFNGVAASPYVEHLYEKCGIHYRGFRAENLRLRFQEIISAAAKPFVNEPVVSHNIDGILTALAAESAVTVNEFLRPTLEYIANHFDEPISIEELAALSLMSPSNLIRYFRRCLDETPHEYILLYRLKQSKRLLVSTTESIERIAELCGFNSASHFARAFKKENQMTPKEFRAIGI